jgi:uncharacterized protein (DUF736 family)
MTQIGLFETMPDGFAGRIHCLKLDAEVRIVGADPSDAEHAPDYRIMLGDDNDAVEVGAGWKRVGEKAGNYLSLLIDDPTFVQPIYANLFQSGSDPTVHILLWNRQAKRQGQS